MILVDLGFLLIDKAGADFLFQVISLRYKQGALAITSNRAFNDWPEIFNNDSTLTSAILDQLLDHAETFLIQGKSYRMKEQIEVGKYPKRLPGSFESGFGNQPSFRFRHAISFRHI